MKKQTKSILILVICFLIISAFLFLPYLLTNTPFVLGWDFRGQYNMFYSNLQTMLDQLVHEHTLPFYSWSLFLGNNFWASKLFYYHDLFDWIAALTSTAHYFNVQLILSFMKLAIAAFSFYLYGHTRGWKRFSILIGSLLFAFSSYAIEALKDPLFLSFYVFIPLYFFAMEQYLKKNKRLFYILITCFLLVTNYYSFYTLSLFSVFYFLYRYYELHHSFQGLIKSAGILIGFYLIGVCMAGIVVLPCFYDITGNSRILSSSFRWNYPVPQPYFYILSALFTPSSMIINRALDFESIYSYVTPNRTDLYLCLWSGSLCALLLFQNLLNPKVKKQARIFLGSMLLIMLIPLGSSMMHGFSEPSYRWLQMLVFFNITLIMPYLDQPELINKKGLLITLAAAALILIFNIPLLASLLGIPFADVKKEYLLILPTLLFLILFCVLLLKPGTYQKAGILVLCITELSYTGYQSLFGNPFFKEWSWERINQVEQVLGTPGELQNYLLGLDTANYAQMFRVYIPKNSIYWGYSSNLNLKYQFNGVMTYDSTFSPALNDLSSLIENPNYLPWNIEIEDPFLLDYIGVKYAVVTDEAELPHSDFILKGQFQGLPVYENLRYQGIVHSYGQAMTIEEYQQHPDSALLLNTFICDISVIEEVRNYLHDSLVTVNELYAYGNTLQTNLTSSEATLITLSIPYDKGWKVLVNGSPVEKFSGNGGMIAFSIPQGTVQLEMYYMPQGFKSGLVLSGLGILIFLILAGFDLRQRYRSKN